MPAGGAGDAGRQLVAREFVAAAPSHLRRFLGERKLPGVCGERKDQIVMEMERLAFARGNAVNVHPGQAGWSLPAWIRTAVSSMASRRAVSPSVTSDLFHVPAGKQPAAMPMMMHQQELTPFGCSTTAVQVMWPG